VLEEKVMTGLQSRIMTDDAIDRFGTQYIKVVNAARLDRMNKRTALTAELDQVDGEHRRLVDALAAGVPVEKVKNRMIELDRREKELKELLADVPDPINKPLLHPTMASRYREALVSFRAEYFSGAATSKAFEALRAMIDRIDLTPEQDPDTGKLVLAATLVGDLAGILRVAESPETGQRVIGEVKRWGFQPFQPKRPAKQPPNANSAPGGSAVVTSQVKMVAGARFELTTFRL
jgi:site-specific DNA recombinase